MTHRRSQEMSALNGIRLSPHFTLGEETKTKHKTADGNIPLHVHIENLHNICEGWLEDLRYSYNMLYREEPAAANEVPVIITSGYRSPEVNRLAAKKHSGT